MKRVNLFSPDAKEHGFQIRSSFHGFVRLEAKPGKEAAVEEFPRAGAQPAENESATTF